MKWTFFGGCEAFERWTDVIGASPTLRKAGFLVLWRFNCGGPALGRIRKSGES